MNQFDGLRRGLVDVALREVGAHEQGGSNLGARVEVYQAATTLPIAAWPWCAAFVAWCLAQWIHDPKVIDTLQLADPATWRFRSARAFDLESWGRAHGASLISSEAPCKPGDLVTYSFSHCGIVVRDNGDGTFEAVEGNTGADGSRDGDGVYLKRRPKSAVRYFVRLLP